MPNTYSQMVYHIVFSTKNRKPVLNAGIRPSVFRYIGGIHEKIGCRAYIVNGFTEHVHVLASVSARMAISDYVRKIKTGSGNWIRRSGIIKDWPGWQDGYAVFTLGWDQRENVRDYVANQESHHSRHDYPEEFKNLLSAVDLTESPYDT